MGKNFGKVWIVTFVVMIVLFGIANYLLRGAVHADMIMPWHAALNLKEIGALIIAMLVGSFAFAYVFLQGYKGKGAGEGVRFGIWVWLLAAVPFEMIDSALLPEGKRLPIEIIIAQLIVFVVAGIAAASMAGSGEGAKGAGA